MSTDALASNRRRCRTRLSRSPSTRPRSPSAHVCLTLFVLALKRTLARQEDVVSTMLERYDYRLAEFAQTLSDALNQTLPARITAAISGTPSTEVRLRSRAPTTRASSASSSSPASRRPPTRRSRSSGRAKTRSSRRSASRRPRSTRSEGSGCPTTVERGRSRSRSRATTDQAPPRSAAASRCRSWTRRPILACSPC